MGRPADERRVMRLQNTYMDITAEYERLVAISVMDLHECIKAAQRACALVEGGKYAYAMQMAGTLAGIAQSTARRLEAAQTMKSTAARMAAAALDEKQKEAET